MDGSLGAGLGFLFCPSSAAVSLESGAELELGGQRWTATVLSDRLLLTRAVSVDNTREQAALRAAEIKNEIRKREEDVAAIGEQQSQLLNRYEEVVVVHHCPLVEVVVVISKSIF